MDTPTQTHTHTHKHTLKHTHIKNYPLILIEDKKILEITLKQRMIKIFKVVQLPAVIYSQCLQNMPYIFYQQISFHEHILFCFNDLKFKLY